MKNLKIGTQIQLAFAAILFFVIIIAMVSYWQSGQIHQQTDTMYNHPVKVRRAIGALSTDIQSIRVNMMELVISSEDKEIASCLNQIEILKANTFDETDNIYDSYLGPRQDVDSLKQALIIWDSVRDETIRLFRAGKTREAVSRVKIGGIDGYNVEKTLAALKKIDNFARMKGDSLYSISVKLIDSLNWQLMMLTAAILLITILINYILTGNIRKPLIELTKASIRFHEGDLNSRSLYASKNEFGILSGSFNIMVNDIQQKTESDKKVLRLASLMLSKYEAKEFFIETLKALITHTGSQMAAVYLLSEDHETFELFESIGLNENARQSFAATNFEGEFGLVLSSMKVQHISTVPSNTQFTFNTVSGKFIPREIITIPIVTDSEVIAIISLANLNPYSKQSIQVIDHIFDTLRARVEGIIAYHKIREFSEKLELQNRELESQKTELSSQAGELKKQNTELEMQKIQLREASKLKTNFLSNMSHELRTPLNSVIALSGVLNRRLAGKIPAEEYSYLEVIERNGKQLLSLINDILDISRIEAGKEETYFEEFKINDLIAEVVAMIHPQAEQRNIRLLHNDASSDLSIFSDVDKCHHILQNLIGNAVKFTEEGEVSVMARQIQDNIEITVTDSGIGISEEHLPHIFNEFRQVDSGTSRRFGGSGLGLAIAKKYANLVGGTISVISSIGTGSKFTLTLPLRHRPEKIIAREKNIIGFKHPVSQITSESVPGLSRKTILLVEDSEPAVVQLKDILEESGYQLLVAHDGIEALKIVEQTIPDAMILDLMMPGIDGFEVLKTLRDIEPTAAIPVLILTAKQITREELRFLTRNNIHQLIQKGDVNRNDLQSAVAAMVLKKTVDPVGNRVELKTFEGKPVVLVVEDNPDNMISVKAILSDNHTVLEASDAISGIEIAKKQKPDLIMMDIGLPGMNGIEAFKVIRQSAGLQHIPVIALTASAMISDQETILSYGMEAFITKPIDEEILFKTINSVLYGK